MFKREVFRQNIQNKNIFRPDLDVLKKIIIFPYSATRATGLYTYRF